MTNIDAIEKVGGIPDADEIERATAALEKMTAALGAFGAALEKLGDVKHGGFKFLQVGEMIQAEVKPPRETMSGSNTITAEGVEQINESISAVLREQLKELGGVPSFGEKGGLHN